MRCDAADGYFPLFLKMLHDFKPPFVCERLQYFFVFFHEYYNTIGANKKI